MSSAAARVIALLLLAATAGAAAAQSTGTPPAAGTRLWQEVQDHAAAAEASPPTFGTRYLLDRQLLDTRLAALAAASEAAGGRVDTDIELPVGGGYQTYRVHAVHVLAPELAVRHPGILTFAGAAVDAPERRVRITVTPESLHARIFLRHEPLVVVRAPDGLYLAVPEHSQISSAAPPVACATGDATIAADVAAEAASGVPASVEDLTIYRLAVAATSGFSAAHGGTIPAVLGRIATAVNSVNEVFERDAGASFRVVAESERVIFTDHRDDPFLTEDPEELLERAQSVLDCRVGSDRYDVGHVLNTAGHSLAQPESAGRDGLKGRGATGVDGIGGNVFDLAYLAHELGHQLGAGHTYTGRGGRCYEKTFDTASAVEPGSGSTIMSYAGVCAEDDLQAQSDPYFHARSIRQILAFRRRFAAEQPPPVELGNRAPRADAGPPATVPWGTPFRLKPAAGSEDPDGDLLTYSWEQVDVAATQVPLSSPCCTAFYRSVPPSLADSQDNRGYDATCPGPCDLTFALALRDNRPGGGAVALDHRRVWVNPDAGPFRITHPEAGAQRPGRLEVRWDLARTDAVLGVDRVEILLICDGEVHQAVETDNDGRHALRLPDGLACAVAKVEVQPVGEIFFARSESFQVTCEEP